MTTVATLDTLLDGIRLALPDDERRKVHDGIEALAEARAREIAKTIKGAAICVIEAYSTVHGVTPEKFAEVLRLLADPSAVIANLVQPGGGKLHGLYGESACKELLDAAIELQRDQV